jgi:hypothetical protein
LFASPGQQPSQIADDLWHLSIGPGAVMVEQLRSAVWSGRKVVFQFLDEDLKSDVMKIYVTLAQAKAKFAY